MQLSVVVLIPSRSSVDWPPESSKQDEMTSEKDDDVGRDVKKRAKSDIAELSKDCPGIKMSLENIECHRLNASTHLYCIPPSSSLLPFQSSSCLLESISSIDPPKE